MIPRLHNAPSRSLVLARVRYDAQLAFSSSAVSFARIHPQQSAGERAHSAKSRPRRTEDKAEENEIQIRSHKDPYGHFRKNVASSFRDPSPRKWLGRDVPFPLNPSFKPPVPLSDELRTRLYRAYMIDPELNSVRTLAIRHNLSIKRVDAILRLKGMEEAWKKNKPLQTGFTKGMEYLLGVTDVAKRAELADDHETDHLGESDQSDSSNRYDIQEADLQDEAEGNNRARHRYQRLFWESVAEGEEPVMPGVLEGQRGISLARTKFKGKTTLVERAPGRPAIMFIDIGNAFVDEKERERREREGARRSTLKARKRMRGHNLHA